MLSEKMQQALNDQINHELYSSYLYLSMAAHFEAANLGGFARWMQAQAREEQEHGMRFFAYLQNHGARVALKAIAQPPSEFGSPLKVFEAILAHEQFVTGTIRALYEVALKENDYATQIMLQWFINEQIEEEKNAQHVIEQLRIVGEQGAALFMLNAQLGARGG